MPEFKSRCFALLLWNEKVLLASCFGRSTQWVTVGVCWTPLLPHDPLMGHFPHYLYNILWLWSMKPNGRSSWTLPQPLPGVVLGTRGCSTVWSSSGSTAPPWAAGCGPGFPVGTSSGETKGPAEEPQIGSQWWCCLCSAGQHAILYCQQMFVFILVWTGLEGNWTLSSPVYP